MIAGGVVTWILICLSVPQIIELIWQHKSPKFVFTALRGGEDRSAAFYQEKWSQFATAGSVLLIVLCTTLAFRPVRNYVLRPSCSTADQLRLPRQLVLNGAILAIVGISAVQIVLGRDDLPFSSYKMYSQPHKEYTLSEIRLIGVTSDQDEIPLSDRSYLYPFGHAQTREAIRKLRKHGGGDEEVARILRYVFARYSARQARGEHTGPPLDGIRVYEMAWHLDRDKSTLEDPFRRTLLGEYLK